MRNCCLLLLILLLACCHHKPQQTTKHVTISGSVPKGGNDTLLIYGNDIFFDKVDTIIADSTGHFSQNVSLDTLVWTTLVYQDSINYPLFMNKGENITININKKKKYTIDIQGNENNALVAQFYQMHTGDSISNDTLKAYAQEFIKKHPNKIASFYFLNKYFVDIDKPSTPEILHLINLLSGELQDRAYIIDLQKKAEEGIIEENNSLPYFTINDMEGKSISRSDYYSNALFLYFWASWDENSIKKMADIKKMIEKCKKSKGFKVLGVSLDINKETWLETIKKEKLDKQQICDFKGWNSDFIQQIKVHELPTILLINRYGTINCINPDLTEVEKAIKEFNEQERNTRHIYN